MWGIIFSHWVNPKTSTPIIVLLLASNTFGCLLDALVTKWTPYFICKIHTNVLDVKHLDIQFYKE